MFLKLHRAMNDSNQRWSGERTNIRSMGLYCWRQQPDISSTFFWGNEIDLSQLAMPGKAAGRNCKARGRSAGYKRRSWCWIWKPKRVHCHVQTRIGHDPRTVFSYIRRYSQITLRRSCGSERRNTEQSEASRLSHDNGWTLSDQILRRDSESQVADI